METEIEIKEFEIEKIPLSCTWIVIGAPGSGKCFDPSTPVMMFDGSVKEIKDITVSELVMGDDSTPRKVLGLGSGIEEMYTVSCGKREYTVNGSHLLCLLPASREPKIYPSGNSYDVTYFDPLTYDMARIHFTLGRTREMMEFYSKVLGAYVACDSLEISVNDFLSLTEAERESWRGYWSSVEFSEKKTTVQSYFYGSWLGSVTVSRDHLWFEERYPRSKGIDKNYLLNTRRERIQLFQGMIGTESVSVVEGGYLFSTPFQKLKEDFVFLCNSLGLDTDIAKDATGEEAVFVKEYNPDLLSYSPTISLFPVVNLAPLKITPKGSGEYSGFELSGNGKFLLGNLSVVHNTTFIKDLIYKNRHKYPCGQFTSGTEDSNKAFSNAVHPLFTFNGYNEKVHNQYISRQKLCKNEIGALGASVAVIDDCSDEPKIYNNKCFLGTFKNGSQHWNSLFVLGMQYAVDLKPSVRKSVSYVAIFREPEEEERKKLYRNFGGICGSYNTFCQLMDQLTGDYTCIIFRKRSQSNELSENVFWYKADLHDGDLDFGCKEFNEYGDKRYDKGYTPDY